eukprot:m51a1_g3898 hypothetical protein (1572) ;mRNA; r:88246-93927
MSSCGQPSRSQCPAPSDASPSIADLVSRGDPSALASAVRESMRQTGPDFARAALAALASYAAEAPGAASGTQLSAADAAEMRSAVVEAVADALCDGTASGDTSPCVTLVLSEIDTCSARVAMHVADAAVDACVGLGGRPLSLLPKALAAVELAAEASLSAQPPAPAVSQAAAPRAADDDDDAATGDHPSDASDEGGDEPDKKGLKKDGEPQQGGALTSKLVGELKSLKASVVARLCGEAWPPAGVVRIVSCLRDICGAVSLPKVQAESLARQAVDQLAGVALEELFAYTGQLLYFASASGTRAIVMKGLADKLNLLDMQCKETEDSASQLGGDAERFPVRLFREAEGSIVCFINSFACQDEDLMKEYVKVLKKDPAPMKPFNVAMLLSASRAPRLEKHLFSSLLDLVSSSNYGIQLGKPPDVVEANAESVSPAESALSSVSVLSATYWDVVTPAIVKFAMYMLETCGAKGKDETSRRVCALAQGVLGSVFAHHQEHVRVSVVDTICSGIVSMSSSSPAFISALGHVVKEVSDTRSLSACLGKLRAVMDMAHRMPAESMGALLTAIRPSLVSNKSLLDSALISLRKAMFSKEAACRESAVTGILQLCKGIAEERGAVDDAPGTSQSASRLSGDASIVVRELFGVLSRALSQQAAVRTRLYHELAAVCKTTPMLIGQAASFVLPHVQRYFTPAADDSPVKLRLCFDERTLAEPLHILVQCCAQMVCAASAECIDDRPITQLSDLIATSTAKLVSTTLSQPLTLALSRVLNTEMEALGVRTTAEVEPDGVDAITENRNNAAMIYHLLEAMIDFVVLSTPLSIDSVDTVLRLHDKMAAFRDVAFQCEARVKDKDKDKDKKPKDKDKDESKKAAKDKGPRFCPSIITADTIHKLLEAMYSHDSEEPIRTALLTSADFHWYVTDACSQLLKKENEFDFATNVGPLIYQRFLSSFATDRAEKTRNQTLSLVLLENFEQCVQFVCHKCSSKAVELFLRKCNAEADEDADCNVAIHKQGLAFERNIEELMEGDAAAEAEVFCKAVQHMSPFFPMENLGEHARFIKALCQKESSSTKTAKALVLLFMDISKTLGSQIQTHFAMDVRQCLGSVKGTDKDEAAEFRDRDKNYGIATAKTAESIAGALIDFANEALDEIDWIISRSSSVESAGSSPREQLYVVVRDVVSWLEHLVKTELGAKNSASLAKVMTRVFKILCNSAKELLRAYQQKAREKRAAQAAASFQGKKVVDDDDESPLDATAKKFRALTKSTGRGVAVVIYTLIDRIVGAEGHKNTKTVGRIATESRIIPALVYSIEEFESVLVSLSKKSGVDFLKDFKKSKSRDFTLKIEEDEPDEDAAADAAEESNGEENYAVRDLTKDESESPQSEAQDSDSSKKSRKSQKSQKAQAKAEEPKTKKQRHKHRDVEDEDEDAPGSEGDRHKSKSRSKKKKRSEEASDEEQVSDSDSKQRKRKHKRKSISEDDEEEEEEAESGQDDAEESPKKHHRHHHKSKDRKRKKTSKDYKDKDESNDDTSDSEGSRSDSSSAKKKSKHKHKDKRKHDDDESDAPDSPQPLKKKVKKHT